MREFGGHFECNEVERIERKKERIEKKEPKKEKISLNPEEIEKTKKLFKENSEKIKEKYRNNLNEKQQHKTDDILLGKSQDKLNEFKKKKDFPKLNLTEDQIEKGKEILRRDLEKINDRKIEEKKQELMELIARKNNTTKENVDFTTIINEGSDFLEKKVLKHEDRVKNEFFDVRSYTHEMIDESPTHLKVNLIDEDDHEIVDALKLDDKYLWSDENRIEIDFSNYPEKPTIIDLAKNKLIDENDFTLLKNWDLKRPPKILDLVGEIKDVRLKKIRSISEVVAEKSVEIKNNNPRCITVTNKKTNEKSLEKDTENRELPRRKPPGYWKKWENLENALNEIIKNEYNKEKGEIIKRAGEYPTEIELRELKQRALLNAIQRHHGGFMEVRKKMGYESDRNPPGHWKKWENVENALNKIIKNEYKNKKGEVIKNAGEFPTQSELLKINQTALIGAIQRHHGGFSEVRKKMGYESDRNPPGHWKKWENVENALNKIIKNEYKDKKGKIIKKMGEFPTQSQLRKMKQSALTSAIQRHHGGFSEVRKKMGYESVQNPSGHWKIWEHLEKELQKIIKNEYKNEKGEIIKKLGEFPNSMEIKDMGKEILLYAAKNHGGWNNVRELMGFPPESMSKKIEYYRKRGFATEKAVIEVMKDWMDLNGFPYSKDKQTIVAPGRQLECVCGKGNTVGIDVTNSKTIGSVEDKWNVKEYQKYVDQLWVVVVSNKFNENQYKKWNEESPSNVVVIDYRSLEKFLNSFNTGDVNFNIPRQKKIQLDALARCTFENREEIRKKYEADRKQKTIDDYFEE